MLDQAYEPWCSDPLDLFRLATIVQNDRLPKDRPDAIYLFGHTPDTEEGILLAGRRLYQFFSDKESLPVYILGGPPYRPPGAAPDSPIAYSGFVKWRDWLVESASIPGECIRAIQRPPLAHTGTEAEALIKLALEHQWKRLIVVGAHMHMLRAFTNTVTFAVRSHPKIDVYACAGRPPAHWQERVLSSQGDVHGSILQVGFQAEWERLNRWHNKIDPETGLRDLLSAREILDYISRREEKTITLLNPTYS